MTDLLARLSRQLEEVGASLDAVEATAEGCREVLQRDELLGQAWLSKGGARNQQWAEQQVFSEQGWLVLSQRLAEVHLQLNEARDHRNTLAETRAQETLNLFGSTRDALDRLRTLADQGPGLQALWLGQSQQRCHGLESMVARSLERLEVEVQRLESQQRPHLHRCEQATVQLELAWSSLRESLLSLTQDLQAQVARGLAEGFQPLDTELETVLPREFADRARELEKQHRQRLEAYSLEARERAEGTRRVAKDVYFSLGEFLDKSLHEQAENVARQRVLPGLRRVERAAGRTWQATRSVGHLGLEVLALGGAIRALKDLYEDSLTSIAGQEAPVPEPVAPGAGPAPLLEAFQPEAPRAPVDPDGDERSAEQRRPQSPGFRPPPGEEDWWQPPGRAGQAWKPATIGAQDSPLRAWLDAEAETAGRAAEDARAQTNRLGPRHE